MKKQLFLGGLLLACFFNKTGIYSKETNSLSLSEYLSSSYKAQAQIIVREENLTETPPTQQPSPQKISLVELLDAQQPVRETLLRYLDLSNLGSFARLSKPCNKMVQEDLEYSQEKEDRVSVRKFLKHLKDISEIEIRKSLINIGPNPDFRIRFSFERNHLSEFNKNNSPVEIFEMTDSLKLKIESNSKPLKYPKRQFIKKFIENIKKNNLIIHPIFTEQFWKVRSNDFILAPIQEKLNEILKKVRNQQ